MGSERKRVGLISVSEDVSEIEELASAAGYTVAFEIVQRRDRPDPSTFVGKGKLDEVSGLLDKLTIDGLLINGYLRPSQHYNLENTLKVECMDRVRLVLNIFATRASSRESILQVERAKLEYETPLLKEWIHSAKMGEHPGFLSGGEYAVDVYYDMTKKRIRKIDEELERLRSTSDLRRRQRKRKGVSLVSLAGYTNAGKSSLMNALTKGDVYVGPTVFSTLTTTTRRLRNGGGGEILVTDTIGFFHDLPTFVIESFKTTIDEIYLADFILLIVDSSENDETIEMKLRASASILQPEVEADRILLVMNKVDRRDETRGRGSESLRQIIGFSGLVWTSATTGEGLDELLSVIHQRFSYPNLVRISLAEGPESEKVISRLYGIAEIGSVSRKERIEIIAALREKDLKRVEGWVREASGTFRIEDGREGGREAVDATSPDA
ncbi:MAG: GTPase HflX [Methanomassiliicoccales archaeon]|nr:GTPase HflX [Methanomassiliicoccales archaeon]